jgi:hypothetical protein
VKSLEVNTVEASGAACYFPLNRGRYEVKPGLMPLGTNLGNFQADAQVFQIDSNFTQYRQAKLLARKENLSSYYQTCNYTPTVAGAIARLIIERLTSEHPQHFYTQKAANNLLAFHSRLTGDILYLDANWQLQQVQSQVIPPLNSTFDALSVQVQEDLAVVSRNNEGTNWLSAIHLCYPNHWSVEEKIGRDFGTVHAPVAGMEKINQRSHAIVHQMITQKPMVRFAWGLSTDTQLNRHPRSPVKGRIFDIEHPQLYLRIERQVIWGLPEFESALFTIRTYFRDCNVIKKDPILRFKLHLAIQSMTPESLVYKGLIESKNAILAWLADE